MNFYPTHVNHHILSSNILDGIFDDIFFDDINLDEQVNDYLCFNNNLNKQKEIEKNEKYNKQIEKLIYEENERLRIMKENTILNTKILIQERFNNIFELNNIISISFFDPLIINEIKEAIKNYCKLKEKKIILSTNSYDILVHFLNSYKHPLNDVCTKKIFDIIEEKCIFESDDEYIYCEEN